MDAKESINKLKKDLKAEMTCAVDEELGDDTADHTFDQLRLSIDKLRKLLEDWDDKIGEASSRFGEGRVTILNQVCVCVCVCVSLLLSLSLLLLLLLS